MSKLEWFISGIGPNDLNLKILTQTKQVECYWAMFKYSLEYLALKALETIPLPPVSKLQWIESLKISWIDGAAADLLIIIILWNTIDKF